MEKTNICPKCENKIPVDGLCDCGFIDGADDLNEELIKGNSISGFQPSENNTKKVK